MSQKEHTKTQRKWKQLSEKERYKVETLNREGITTVQIATRMGRHRRTAERELMRGSVIQRHTNPSASKSTAEPEYLEEKRYFADAGQRVKEERTGTRVTPSPF